MLDTGERVDKEVDGAARPYAYDLARADVLERDLRGGPLFLVLCHG